MTGKQYEELCRLFLAEFFRIGIDRIHSVDYPNPTRLLFPEYFHQLDLYWELETTAVHLSNVANAKWRTAPDVVQQADVLLLQQVKTKVAAHKAYLLTNTGFSSEARAVADDEGIALHVVRPVFNAQGLPATDAARIQSQLQSLARGSAQALYDHQVIHKGLQLPTAATASCLQSTEPEVRRAVFIPSPSASAPSSPSVTVAPSVNYPTKQGPGRGFRTS